jgi:dTDP-4-amino-4,6-dideoxygalactose transaminase
VPDYADPVWHLFVIRHAQRDAIRDHLTKNGVNTVIHYPTPPHRQSCYSSFSNYALPVAEMLAGDVLSLPMSPDLRADEIEMVCKILSEIDEIS